MSSDADQSAPVGFVEFRGECRECGREIVFRPPSIERFPKVMSVRVFCGNAECRTTNYLDRVGAEGEQ